MLVLRYPRNSPRRNRRIFDVVSPKRLPLGSSHGITNSNRSRRGIITGGCVKAGLPRGRIWAPCAYSHFGIPQTVTSESLERGASRASVGTAVWRCCWEFPEAPQHHKRSFAEGFFRDWSAGLPLLMDGGERIMESRQHNRSVRAAPNYCICSPAYHYNRSELCRDIADRVW